MEDQVLQTLAGSSGWTGAGLLGLVLGWFLLYYLPKKEKAEEDRSREHRESYEKVQKEYTEQINNILDKKWQLIEQMQKEFSINLKDIAAHCSSELKVVTDTFRRENDRIIEAVKDLKNVK